jgi:hypothetical protein
MAPGKFGWPQKWNDHPAKDRELFYGKSGILIKSLPTAAAENDAPRRILSLSP